MLFLVHSNPHFKFHQNGMENVEVENFLYRSVLVGRAGRSKNGHNHFIQIRQKTQNLKILAIGPFWLAGLVVQNMAVATYNSFYIVFRPLSAPMSNLN